MEDKEMPKDPPKTPEGELEKALAKYIAWYNRSRIKLSLLMSPSQYRETLKS